MTMALAMFLFFVGITLLIWYWPKRQPSLRRKEREIWEQ